MSVTASAPARRWAYAHRAALAIIILSMALAASLGLLAARLVTGAVPVPTTVSDNHLQPTDDGCRIARPGHPC